MEDDDLKYLKYLFDEIQEAYRYRRKKPYWMKDFEWFLRKKMVDNAKDTKEKINEFIKKDEMEI